MTAQTIAPSGRTQSDLAGVLADHAASLTYADLPKSTVEAAKCLMLDTLGAAIAGRFGDGCQELEGLVTRWAGEPAARIWGSGRMVPAHNAALLNSSMGRALEIDDVHEKALLHSTVSMVPIALAIAELQGGASGRDVIAAVALGVDMAARLALSPTIAVGGEEYEYRGMSWTYQTSYMMGSLVAGKLLGFDRDQLRNALGVAYSMCAGNQQCLIEGSLTVRVQQGIASQGAVMAAEMSRAGITGTLNSLEGRFGWFNTFYRGRYDRSIVTEGLGERYETEQVSIKPFTCCKYTHTAIAAALDARAKGGFAPQEIERVVVHVNNREYWNVVCDPLAPKRNADVIGGPRGEVVAQFSLPYVVAAALTRGRVGLAEFTEATRNDRGLLDLTARVEPVIDVETDSLEGRIIPTPGMVDVYLKGGSSSQPRIVKGYARYAKGHPENPMSYDEVAEKLRDVVRESGCGMPQAHIERVVGTMRRIEELDDVRELIGALVWEPLR